MRLVPQCGLSRAQIIRHNASLVILPAPNDLPIRQFAEYEKCVEI